MLSLKIKTGPRTGYETDLFEKIMKRIGRVRTESEGECFMSNAP